MTIKKDQDNILNIAESGGLTSKLHASVLFPDVFGPLAAQDRRHTLADTSSKNGPNAGQSIRQEKQWAKGWQRDRW